MSSLLHIRQSLLKSVNSKLRKLAGVQQDQPQDFCSIADAARSSVEPFFTGGGSAVAPKLNAGLHMFANFGKLRCTLQDTTGFHQLC